jgi:HEAT repeat protein
MADSTPMPTLDPRDRRLLTIAQNVRDLASRDAHVSAAALARLTDLAPLPGELVRLLDDRDPFVRSGAARQLRNTPPEFVAEAVDALRAAIDDGNDHVVEAALGSLGVLRAEEARADVRACLHDANPRVVHAAVFALGRIGPAAEGKHLVRFLDAEPAHLQVMALNALVQLGYAQAVPALAARLEACLGQPRHSRADFELPRRLIRALVALRGVEAVPLLVRIAQEEVGVRGIAVQALIDLRADSAAAALLPLLSRLFDSVHEERLCVSLLYLMTAVDYRFAVPEVRRFLGHKLAGVRSAALKAVARWGDVEALEQVRLLCSDPSAFVRPVAVACLARLLGPAALPELRALAGDANTLVRAAVADALGRLDPLPAEAAEVLRGLLADESTGRTARAALARHEGAAAGPALLPTAALPLLPPELRTQAAAARAFLRQWQAGLHAVAGADGAGEVERALRTLLGALAEPQTLPSTAA